MHEISVAANIIEIATEHLKRVGGGAIAGIEVEVGELSGVVTDALSFALEHAVQGTTLEHADVTLIETKGQALCRTCQQSFPVDSVYAFCPVCGSFVFDVTTGKDLKVMSLKIIN